MIQKDLKDTQLSDKSKMQNSVYGMVPFVFFAKETEERKFVWACCIYIKKITKSQKNKEENGDIGCLLSLRN